MRKKVGMAESALYALMKEPVLSKCILCGKNIKTLGEPNFYADTVCTKCASSLAHVLKGK